MVTVLNALLLVNVHESHRLTVIIVGVVITNVRKKLAVSLGSINPIIEIVHSLGAEGILLGSVVDNVRANHKRQRENLSLTVYYYSILHTSRVVN